MKKQSSNVLIVDDDPGILQSARVVLRQHFTKVDTTDDPQQIRFMLQQLPYDAILLDMNFTTGVTGGSEGMFWLKTILTDHPGLSVVMVTAYGDLALAVEAMKVGAVDFIVKPWQNEKLVATVKAAAQLTQSRREVSKLKIQQQRLSEVYSASDVAIIGKSTKMNGVLEMVERVASTEASVLLTGENGTGKELIAQTIHRKSARKDGPFIKVDVGTLPETLFESEIFGHKKGAFTDAQQDRMGRFELASGGTLFLDEIGNLALPLQAKLLTALQNRVITPLGSNQEVQLDIRVISATNQPIQSMIAEGRFREDLLYRLNTVEIELPPLRDRLDDLSLLLDHFVGIYSNKYHKQVDVEAALVSELKQYKWPGNIREFQHAVERAIILCDKTLGYDNFLLPRWDEAHHGSSDNLNEVERRAIAEAIRKHNGNLSQAAKTLGLGRTTLYRKIQKYGL